MCGVVGGVGEPSDAAVAALRHRGPDAEAVVSSEGFWLGHTRLSVIDPGAASDQPFRRGAVSLVFNGEIWNYRELRNELRAAGARFRTVGDTEVLAAALERWGEAALPRLQGMFAVAWTCGDGVLRLARDRHGEVPLHVSPGPRFLFASELKALDAAGAPRASWGWVEPGELLEVGPGGLRRRRWYDVPRLQSPAGQAEARAAVRGGRVGARVWVVWFMVARVQVLPVKRVPLFLKYINDTVAHFALAFLRRVRRRVFQSFANLARSGLLSVPGQSGQSYAEHVIHQRPSPVRPHSPGAPQNGHGFSRGAVTAPPPTRTQRLAARCDRRALL